MALDFATGVMARALPWVVGFVDDRWARNTSLAMGVVGITVSLLSELLTGLEEMPSNSNKEGEPARSYPQ